jgi:hypothetical protein
MKKYHKILLAITAILILTIAFPTKALAAPLEDDRTIFGEDYTLESGRILDGDLNVIGGMVDIESDATVNGNVLVIGGLVSIDGIIAGDLTVVGGTVNLEENAVVQGNLISPASYINRDPGAVIEGDQIEGWSIPWTNTPLPDFYRGPNFRTPQTQVLSIATRIGRGIAFSLIITALGALLLLIMPKSTGVMTEALERQPWLMLGFGALTALVMLIGGVLFTITICLIPIVILAGLTFGLAVLIGWLTLGYELGKKISESLFKTSWHPVLSAAVGNLLLYLIASGLDLIPCLGGFLVLITMLFGLGTTVVTLFGTNPYPRSGQQPQEEKLVLFENKQSQSENEWLVEEVIPASEDKQAGRPVEELGLDETTTRTLKNAGLTTVDDVLERFTNEDAALRTIDGLGEKSLQDLKETLSQLGYDIPGSSE